MTPKPTSERRLALLAAVILVAVFLLTRFSHHSARTGPAPAAAAEPSLNPVPSEPPTPAAIAELQARNTSLHWAAVDSHTVIIATAKGSCGTLAGLTPTQINFHTGRDYDRETHLFSTWSDAYTAAEQYCLTWSSQPLAK